MADAVATQTIIDGAKYATFKFTNVSDGTGEAAVKKIDVSALSKDPVTGQTCSKVNISNIWYSTVGMSVKVLFEYENFHSRPEEKKRRAERNKARKLMEKRGLVRKGDGKDVDHKDRNTGNNSVNNLKVSSKKANRSKNSRKRG